MLASELITELQDWIEHYGDLHVEADTSGPVKSIAWSYDPESGRTCFAFCSESADEILANSYCPPAQEETK